ncbi:amidohydrolase family protein [Symmachiella dynata]|uniref:amidohydrolase family protein n=1 Tax=Symmachiella dynata TaxID=2527995 RepID=UPI0030EC43E3
MNQRQAYRARWVFPGDGPPLERGVIEIEAGRITAVHDRAVSAAHDLGDVAIVPGLVNAHTHLEFSDLKQPIAPALPFTDWIRALVANRRSRDASTSAVAAGKREAERTGTTLLGEIASPGWEAVEFFPPAARVVVFQEILGLAAAQHDPQLALASEHLQQPQQDRLIYGLSPHAPYSVRPALYAALVQLAVEHQCPLAVHLAETRAELELLNSGSGEFVDMLCEFGVWDPTAIPAVSRPLDYLRPLADVEHALAIHGNYLDDEEIAFLSAHPNITVVYCPRTHAYFGHEPHPWQRMLQAGVSVAIGTDSRGSNPDLSLWRELQFLRRTFPEVDPVELLALGTINGARALGLDGEIGTLRPGKSADMAVVALNEAAGELFAPETEVTATMCGGDWIAR